MASIQFERVTKSFDRHTIIHDLDLTIEDGQFTVLVGPSGCGKTTLLRMIAGIGPQSSGRVLIGGKDVSQIAPGKRDVAMVFQNYAIYPTMSVRENIEFGLKNNKVPREKRKRLVESISETVGLTNYLDRKPSSLSGGQRQRVALARAMVKKPAVFLMDEPLSNLDAKLRTQMRIELIELHRELGATFVYVTHDQLEAMSMADTIVLMNEGVIQQKSSPAEIYHRPNNLFAAQFMGVPPMNIGELGHGGVRYGFRPESAAMSGEREAHHHFSLRGTIATREMLGSETLYQVKTAQGAYMVKCAEDRFSVDQAVRIGVAADKLHFFGPDGARVNERSPDVRGYLEVLRGFSDE